jgi:hypothetical protein
MVHFQYSISTKASPKLAWKIFSDWRTWNHFANVYGEVRWREGKPWEPGSRMEIELLHPVNAVVEHVITSCTPEKRVGWIDHAVGVALGQWVTFERGPKGTNVHTWGDIVHSGVTIGGLYSDVVRKLPADVRPIGGRIGGRGGLGVIVRRFGTAAVLGPEFTC